MEECIQDAAVKAPSVNAIVTLADGTYKTTDVNGNAVFSIPTGAPYTITIAKIVKKVPVNTTLTGTMDTADETKNAVLKVTCEVISGGSR